MRVGSDTGGTFTDLVAADGQVVKVPSTASDPARSLRDGLRSFDMVRDLVHGTTVATNTLLECTGGRVALVTNRGLEDLIEIGRQDRPHLYDPTVDRPPVLVARNDRHGITGRQDATGGEIEGLDFGELDELTHRFADVDAVALCLLHSDLDHHHEQAVAQRLRRAGLDVTVSSELCPEMREYERFSTAVINAYLRPRCRAYLSSLALVVPGDVGVLTSSGGLVAAEQAADEPARLLLSGPAGGVAAASAVALANGFPDAVSFDMGGTSTDVCLILNGIPAPAAMRDVAGYPVRLPSLAVHTVGAGGGSIASLDPGGAVVVGPRSAGATPGPACYRRGGTLATVTDADVVLGRISASTALPGLGVLDRSAAVAALDRAGLAAADVVTVVDAVMAEAVRAVTVAQGVDPRGLALVAFGGAGPLHACGLAEAVGIDTVVVPARAGVLSAVGVLAAPRVVERVRSVPVAASRSFAAVSVVVESMAMEVRSDSAPDATVEMTLDARYAGQSHELRVPAIEGWDRAFHAVHRRVNGFDRPETPVEVVAVRVVTSRASPVAVLDLDAPERRAVSGPMVIADTECTIWVPDGWTGSPGEAGALVLRRTTAQ